MTGSAELLPPPELGTERDGVPLPVERLGPTPASLPPANPPPHRSVLQDSSLDLHAATPWLFFIALKDATASRWSHSPALQVHPRTAPPHPHWEAMGQTTRTLSGDYVGGRVVWPIGEQKPQVRRGCTGAQVCNRITHFVTHFPTHLNESAAAPDALCAAHARSRRQQLIGGCAFGTGTRADRLDS